MIRDLAYEALSCAFWATMGTLARLAFWARGPEPESAPPVRASRTTPMPIAPEARVPLNAGKYEPAEDRPAAAQGANVAHMLPKEAISSERVACGEFAGSVRTWVRGRDQWLFACKVSGYEPCSACLAAADVADPRGLDHDLCVAIGLCRDSEREDNRDAAHHFLMVASAHSLSIAGPDLRARVERYRSAARGAS